MSILRRRAESPGPAGVPGGAPVPAAPGCLVLLLMAVEEEASGIIRRLRDPRRGSRLTLRRSPRQFLGRLGDCSVLLQFCGTGPRQASASAERILEVARPSAVVSAGLGGALRSDLREGDLVLPRRVVDLASGVTFECDERLHAAARQAAPEARSGDHTLVTSATVVGTAADKAALAPRASVVDMESAAVARVAARLGLPFLAVRVISDEAGQDFPIDFNRYLDSAGNLQRARLAGAALCRPRGIHFLLHLRRMALEGSRTLSTFMEGFCRVLPDAV